MSGFTLLLNPTSAPAAKEQIVVNLSITNISEKDCYIPKYVIMLDGFKNDKFHIVNSNGLEAIYKGMLVKYNPEFILLQSGQSLSNKLNLSKVYELPESSLYEKFSDILSFGHNAKNYSISYSTQIKCCEDSKGDSYSPSELIEAKALMSITDNDL